MYNRKFFTIEHIYSHNYIGTEVDIDKKSYYPIISTAKIIEGDIISYEWEFIRIENNLYLIRNKLGCFLKDESI